MSKPENIMLHERLQTQKHKMSNNMIGEQNDGYQSMEVGKSGKY